MRMDEIGWNSIHGTDFVNEREHGAGDWLFLLIKSPCRIFVNGEMRQFPAYTWVLYTPDAYQNYGADGEEYYDDWMHFAPDAAEEALLRTMNIPLNTPVALPKGTEISKLLRDICFEFYSAHLHRIETTELYFRMLLYRLHEQLVRVKAVPDSGTVKERLQQIRDFIFRKPFDRFTAARFADELNLSEADFLQQYEAENGSRFQDDLIHTRLRFIAGQMKVHLAENQTVEEVAQLCGYASEEEFSAEFERFIGKSPQAYLDELRAENGI
ncbi:MAG: helix-turn-helix transcriptional regulator [Oscillospiraceae bacterium]|nr:helix-turn-helix transcriptional regulator [Oscillospiraceae bacterium]